MKSLKESLVCNYYKPKDFQERFSPKEGYSLRPFKREREEENYNQQGKDWQKATNE